ncbi:MAG: 30S ribosomal protein S6 [Armatimonadetes bacterium]|nr:30S ribosomal protein S6 [Armatimonadota bacterium]MBS1710678.1 30S ribosomal protein S6 [Armatimonadota bacterium]MBX3108349.1 30S ribosomal protein S6 [Fimbriimonadaceae bacterium]
MDQRNYEAFYIIPGNLTDAEVQEVADHFKEVVEKNGGTVESAGKWEKRKLAYELNGHRDGNYVLMKFAATAQVPNELNRLMRINDTVIRHRIDRLA